MKKKFRIPFATYLCYLLALSVLVTGVTFSRYLSSGGGTSSAPLSRFACSYQISDVSSLAHSNSDFWLTLDTGRTAMNAARTVRFTLRNFEQDAEGTPLRISDVDLQGTIRLYAPLEFAANLALQVVVTDTEESRAITPQYVLGNLIYKVEAGSTQTGGTQTESSTQTGDGAESITQSESGMVYQYVDENGDPLGEEGEKVYASGPLRTIDTKYSPDYQALENAGTEVDEVLSVTGGFSGSGAGFSGTVAAFSEQTGSKLTLTGESRETEYSVGFKRGTLVSAGDLMAVNGDQPALFVDCKEEMPFCSVDITLPAMKLDRVNKTEKTFVLYVTLVERIDLLPSGDLTDNGLSKEEWEELLTFPAARSASKKLGSADVTGFHFVVNEVDAYNALPLPEGATASGGTKVQIRYVYDYVNGGAALQLFHVASLSEDTIEQVHPIAEFYDQAGEQAKQPDSIEAARALFGVCSSVTSTSGYINFSDLPESPYFASHTEEENDENKLSLGEVLSKGYYTRLNVLFVQASES